MRALRVVMSYSTQNLCLTNVDSEKAVGGSVALRFVLMLPTNLLLDMNSWCTRSAALWARTRLNGSTPSSIDPEP